MCTVEGNWNYEFDILNIEKSNFTNFEIIMKNFQECALKTFENTFTADNHTSKDITQKSDDDLRDLIEKNKTLKHEIDIKLKELQQQQKQYETFKQGLLFYHIPVFYTKSFGCTHSKYLSKLDYCLKYYLWWNIENAISLNPINDHIDVQCCGFYAMHFQ